MITVSKGSLSFCINSIKLKVHFNLVFWRDMHLKLLCDKVAVKVDLIFESYFASEIIYYLSNYYLILYTYIHIYIYIIYTYMQSWKQCTLPVITTMALWQLATHALGHMISGRAHCFHDCMYIMPILLLCVVGHVWPLISI